MSTRVPPTEIDLVSADPSAEVNERDVPNGSSSRSSTERLTDNLEPEVGIVAKYRNLMDSEVFN